jgi:hypothetical protein
MLACAELLALEIDPARGAFVEPIPPSPVVQK